MTLEKTSYSMPSLPWYEDLPASAAVRAGDLVFIAGQTGLDASGEQTGRGDAGAQARTAFERIQELLELAGGSMDDVVDLMSFHHDVREIDAVFDAARDYFAGDYPAWTPVGMLGSHRADILVSIRAIAHLGEGSKACYTPDTLKWWRDLPISAGCKKGEYVFVSGQVAADADGNLTTPADHAAQARFALNRIEEIVGHFGGSRDDVIDLLSFHQDARGMVPAGDVQEAAFADIPLAEAPAWTAIGVPGLYRLGMLASWRAIADLSPGKRVAMTPASIWWKIFPISGGTKKEGGSLVAISGEVASDGDGLVTTPGDTARQARYAFNRIREVLEMFGASMENVVEITSFHKDPRAWEIVMDVGRDYFDVAGGPAWTPVGTTGLWNEGYLHEIYALAVV
jgi:enamine deaminase RidA (YjgF/YER057c/UK114 family)